MVMKNKRFAYLIIAHNEPYILDKLVKLLDDERNDIYILIDKKSERSQFDSINTYHSNLIWIKPIDIRWGDISQIAAEYSLFEAAYDSGNEYGFYHLLSGVDLPLKSQDEIHDFFNNIKNANFEFIHYVNSVGNQRDLINKTRYYHLFTHWSRPKSLLSKACMVGVRKFSLFIQKTLGIKRKNDLDLKKGMQWVSLSNNGVEFLLKNKKLVFKNFKYTFCPDEIFVQSLFWTYYPHELIHPESIRLIDWERGKPYTFSDKDFQELINSQALFARKFSTKLPEQKEIIDKLYNSILNKQNNGK